MPKTEPKVERVGDNFIVRGVAIFDEHEDQSRPGVMKNVDAALLSRFVENTNRRLVTEYELPVATGWHTPKPGESVQPPPVIGGYRNFRIDDFEDSKGKRKAVYADVRIPASEWQGARTLQRRSVEAFPDTCEFDTLVLLGSKSPARDLGPLTPITQYGRAAGACVRYEMPNGADEAKAMDDQPAMNTVTLSAESIQALIGGMQTAFASALADVLKADEPDGDEMPMDGEVPADDGAPELFGEDDAPPMDETPAEAPEPTDDEDKENYARRDLKIRYERQAKELTAMKQRLAAVEKREQKERYERQIVELQAEGFEIDSAEEVPYLMGLSSDAQRDAYLVRLKKNANKATVPSMGGLKVDYGRREDPVRYAAGARKENGALTKEQSEEVFRLARTMGYDAARKQVLNGAA